MRDSSLELGRTSGEEGRGRRNACCCLLRLHDIVHALGWTAAIRTSGCFLATTADDLIQMSGR